MIKLIFNNKEAELSSFEFNEEIYFKDKETEAETRFNKPMNMFDNFDKYSFYDTFSYNNDIMRTDTKPKEKNSKSIIFSVFSPYESFSPLLSDAINYKLKNSTEKINSKLKFIDNSYKNREFNYSFETKENADIYLIEAGIFLTDSDKYNMQNEHLIINNHYKRVKIKYSYIKFRINNLEDIKFIN